MLEILTVIAPLFLIIFGSAIIARLIKIDGSWQKVLNSFALNVGFPALIFSALAATDLKISEELDLILVNSVFLIFAFVLAILLGKIFHLKKKMFRTLFICLGFGNVAYLGIPTLMQVSGEAVLPTASLIVAIYLFWMFTLGLGYLTFSQEEKTGKALKKVVLSLVKNPLLIAVVLGILASLLKVQLPSLLNTSISMIAGSVTPLVLVVIGLFIGTSRIGKIKSWIPIAFFSIFTLAVLPALLFYGLQLAGMAPQSFSATIIEAAMPLAITPFALADEYKLDKDFIAKAIVLSTILSVVTIPLWSTLMAA